MFSQRKSFFKGKMFYIVLLALFAFGIWLNQSPVDREDPENISTDTNYSDTTDDTVKEGNSGNYNIMDNIIGNNADTVSMGGIENTDTVSEPGEQENSGYFLVKEIDGVIKIFYYDEEGKESLIRETDIAFSLLGVADQALFQKGVIKNTPEELDELLQDFES